MPSEALRLALLAVALLLATGAGLLLRRRNGRVRVVAGGDRLAAADLDAPLGGRATYVQFSTSVCAPCRATGRVLSALVEDLPGVGHVEVDAEQRLDLARRFCVVRTPTVLVVDPDGLVVARTSGAMTRAQALAAVTPLLASTTASTSAGGNR